MKRKIPATMASQHPDHAGVPYWHNQEFISVTNEFQECYLMFSEMNIEEYKWDWEGKLVDESVMERLLAEYYEYFKKNPLGKSKFLTFRLPNPKAETEFRLARAFINLLSSAALSKKVGLHSPPLFEVILPMTESAEEMIAIQEAFKEISELKHALFSFDDANIKQLEIIPLFEQVDTIINSDQIITKYLQLYKEKFNAKPDYLRPYMARSDPALNSGTIPTVIAIKIALSRYQKLAKKLNIPLYPILGTALLPFRGGLSPDTVEQFVEEYAGIRTALIQSAFRYDYDKDKAIQAINYLNENLPLNDAHNISKKEENDLISLLPFFENPYKETIEQLAPTINKIAANLPKRRERVQHIGLFGYSRGVGKVTLPRAIGFTAAMYTLGLPPELIGTGAGLEAAIKQKKIKLLENIYKYMKEDLLRAGRYLNKENVIKLSKEFPVLKEVLRQIEVIEKYVGVTFEPESFEEKEHQLLTGKILENLGSGKAYRDLLTRAAVLRKSLG